MIYYIADLHLNHKNIINLCNRPFGSTYEMNDIILNNFNKIVKDEDTVYFLGDIGYPKAEKDLNEIIATIKGMNGKKVIIVGNHDEELVKIREFTDLFEEVTTYKKIKDNDRDVILFHYPIEEWDNYFRGSYHIYGHVHHHKNISDVIKNRFNVGVDVNDFKPITLDELILKNK